MVAVEAKFQEAIGALENKLQVLAQRGQLDPIHVSYLSELAEKLTEKSVYRREIAAEKAFMSDEAVKYAAMRLAAHHATSTVPLKKENFEHLLAITFRRMGAHVPDSAGQNHRGEDIVISGRAYSLKTASSSGNMPRLGKRRFQTYSDEFRVPPPIRSRFTISKFAEARWMREPLAKGSLSKLKTLLDESLSSHLKNYENIFILRNHSYFVPLVQESSLIFQAMVHYELREIPKNLVENAMYLDVADYASSYRRAEERLNRERKPLPPQTITMEVHDPKLAVSSRKTSKRLFSITLDGSVEKVRLTGIDASKCPLHASWTLRAPERVDDDDWFSMDAEKPCLFRERLAESLEQ